MLGTRRETSGTPFRSSSSSSSSTVTTSRGEGRTAISSPNSNVSWDTSEELSVAMRRKWNEFVDVLFASAAAPEKEWRAFTDEYFETHVAANLEAPHRRYHNFRHIQGLLMLAEVQYKHLVTERELVLAAIWFHDLIYDVGPDVKHTQNEHRSAEAFLSFAAEAKRRFFGGEGDCEDLPKWIANADEISVWIRETAQHQARSYETIYQHDFDLFLDLDLSILGTASPSEYDEYAAGVRHEYAHLEREHFVKGRLDFLRGMSIYGENLFKTAELKKDFGPFVSVNIQREIRALEGGTLLPSMTAGKSKL